MKINSKIHDNIGIVTLKGKLMGLPDTDYLNDEVKSLMNQNIKKIILDLHDVDWINSSGIGAIIRSFISVENVVGQFRLVRISDKVASVLDLTQLTKIFKPCKSLDEAIQSFR
jgi:anti-anti-sigma factor